MAATTKKSVYEMVTDRMIEQLEQGHIPWHKPWIMVGGEDELSGAYNRVSKKSYSMLNQMLLSHTGEYASFKQWQEAGGHVRKGEHGEIVVFWKIQNIEETDEDGEKHKKQIPLLRYYTVFHISQVDGVEPLVGTMPEGKPDNTDGLADRLITDYVTREGIDYREELSDRAFYRPYGDMVVVPRRDEFRQKAEFYSTCFHELVHSTGAKNRLDRLFGDECGDEGYSKEELVAEIGAASILNMIGLETDSSFKNSTAYVQSWIAALKNDTRMIVSAASRAEKAVKFMVGDFNPADVTPAEDEHPAGEHPADVTPAEDEKKKKTPRISKKVIVSRFVKSVSKCKPFNGDGRPARYELDGVNYFVYLNNHMMIATPDDYGYETREKPFEITDMILEPLENVNTMTFNADTVRIKIDREAVAALKKENRTREKEKRGSIKPYIIRVQNAPYDVDYVGVNPGYLLDLLDFVRTDVITIYTKDSKPGFYKDGLYRNFIYAVDESSDNIGAVLPVNLGGASGWDGETYDQNAEFIF